MNNDKKPSIRFKGFTNEWKQYKIKDVCSISTGKSNTQDKVEDGIYPFYVRSPIIEKSNHYLYDEEAVLTVGDGVGTGKVFHYVNGKYDLHQRVYRMFDFNSGIFAKYFYYYFSNHFYNRVMSMTAKTSVDSVRYEMISEMNIIFPNKFEQKSIIKMFEYLDKLITVYEHKCNKLKDIKKAMLEKIFPKDGSDVPKIRFKGFTKAWKQYQLNACAERYDNLRLPITACNRISGSTPYYGANGIQDYVDGYTHKGEFVLVAEDGANDLKHYPVQYVTGKIWVNNHTHVLQAKKIVADNKFLKYTISQIDMEFFLVGSGRAKLNANTMMKINIKITKNIREQKKIGIFFERLDFLINLYQQKCEKLKNIKKAMLEKMFV